LWVSFGRPFRQPFLVRCRDLGGDGFGIAIRFTVLSISASSASSTNPASPTSPILASTVLVEMRGVHC